MGGGGGEGGGGGGGRRGNIYRKSFNAHLLLISKKSDPLS